jgi:hypothetical protein
MLSMALIVAAAALVAAPACAQGKKTLDPNDPNFDPRNLPIGLDGEPPSPYCRASRADRAIHCLHNLIWHGGEYYVDDLKPTKRAAKAKR